MLISQCSKRKYASMKEEQYYPSKRNIKKSFKNFLEMKNIITEKNFSEMVGTQILKISLRKENKNV